MQKYTKILNIFKIILTFLALCNAAKIRETRQWHLLIISHWPSDKLFCILQLISINVQTLLRTLQLLAVLMWRGFTLCTCGSSFLFGHSSWEPWGISVDVEGVTLISKWVSQMLSAQSRKFQGGNVNRLAVHQKGRCRSQFGDFTSFSPQLF